MKHFLIILAFSLFAIFIHGYQFAVSDQEIFIPYILKAKDNSLFKYDLLFEQPSSKLSLFYPVYGVTLKFFDLQVIFFVSYVIFQIAFFSAIFSFSKTLTKNKNFAYLSLLPFLMPKFIGGTATPTYDNFFGYRSIGVIFLILYLSHLLQGKISKAVFFAIAGFSFHPLSIIPNIFLLTGKYIEKMRPRMGRLFRPLILGFILIFSVVTIIFLKNLFQDDLWLNVIKFRDNYLFPSKWNVRGWASFWMYLFLIFIFITRLDIKTRKAILLFLSISLTVFIVAYLLIEILKIPQIAKFQLTRSITSSAYIALAVSPYFVTQRKIVPKLIGIIAFVSLSLNHFSIFLISALSFALITLNRSKDYRVSISTSLALSVIVITILLAAIFNLFDFKNVQFPKQESDWIDTQIWARSNTNSNDFFLVPPDQTGFRIFSHRPIIADIKDGAVVIYDRNYAINWFERMQDLSNFTNLSGDQIQKLKSKYDFNFVVTKSSQHLNFPIIYSNNTYMIYKI